MKKALLVATVQSHICQFHKPLAEVLREDGWEIHVAAKDNLKEKNGLKLDFVDRVYEVPFCRSPLKASNVNAYRQLKVIIKNEDYDVIHCNTPVGGILARLAARKVRKNGTKVYYTAHGFHFYKGAPVKNWLMYYPIEKMFAKMTDKLITIVSEDYNFAKRKFKCPVYRIHGTGVDERKFSRITVEEKRILRKQFGFKEEQKIILCVGELLANKNQEMIIRSMPQIIEQNPDTVLLIAGNGPRKDELEALIEALDITENVRMLGYVTNVHEYHKISDLLVSCSIREGLGLNVIEAMMIGNPVVVTNNRGHRELINKGRNGYIVPVNNVERMTESVKKILFSRDAYEKFAHNAQEFVVLYGTESVKKELKKIYEL